METILDGLDKYLSGAFDNLNNFIEKLR